MAIRFTTTAEATKHVKCLIYGPSGIGKTTLCKTAPNPIIISAERGLLSLDDVDIPVMEVETTDDIDEAYEVITGADGADFQTVCIDSLSDIAEALLSQFKQDCGKDPRKAYGQLNDVVMDLARKFRDIPGKHVYITAKLKRIVDDDSGLTTYMPAMPGQQLGPALPYLYDFVMPMRTGVAGVAGEEEEEYRFLQTYSDLQWTGKDRSGKLDHEEEPDLTKLFAKALNPKISRQ